LKNFIVKVLLVGEMPVSDFRAGRILLHCSMSLYSVFYGQETNTLSCAPARRQAIQRIPQPDDAINGYDRGRGRHCGQKPFQEIHPQTPGPAHPAPVTIRTEACAKKKPSIAGLLILIS
jgi:hypothetical protein